MNIFELQQDFMSAAGQETKQYNKEQVNLYEKLIDEEAKEFLDAAYDDYAEFTIKEACDVIVVASGYLISMLGADNASEAYNIVHQNNIAKVTGKIEKRADGKILKGDTNKAERKAKMMGDLLELLNAVN